MTPLDTISVSSLKDFVRLAPIPIALLNLENRYILASDCYKKFYQLPDDIEGHCPDELLPHFKDEWYDYHQKGFEGQHLTNTGLAEEIRLPSGGTEYVRWYIHPWVRAGKVVGILTTIVPVTSYIRSIDEREATIRAFAHDLKGAFVQISTLIDFVSSSDEGIFREHFSELRSTLNYSEKLIDSFHSWAETQQENIALEAVKVKEMAEETFGGVAEVGSGKLIYQSEDGGDPVLLAADPDKLYRLFGNLFSNAIKFQIPDRPLKVWLRVNPKDRGFWEVEVSDNSEGFDSEKYGELVLKPCERLDKNRDGTGMGLAIAQKIAEQHGTSLQIESRVGEGVTVRFLLCEWGQIRDPKN